MSSSAADPRRDRVPVAAPRSSQRSASEHQRVDASGAGLVLLVLIVLAALLGAWVGDLFGVATSGAIMGGVLGLPLGFAGVYARYKSL